MFRKVLLSKSNLFMVFMLCFCIPFSLMFYQCLTDETNYNLKIDRGFVSSKAIYFSLIERAADEGVTAAGESLSEKSVLQEAIRVLDNDPYLFVSQRKYIRAICFQKDMEIPPIREGRFFSSEECWVDNKLAVIGRTNLDRTWMREDTGKRMISLDYGDYEVIGVMGIGDVSTIDDLIFINIGSLETTDWQTGVFYLDTTNIRAKPLFQRFSDEISSVSTLSVREIDMPPTASDVVSGGVFFSEVLKYTIYVFLLITFLCLLVFFILSSRGRLTICLLNGQSYRQSILRVSVPMLFAGLAGIVIAIISAVLMVRFSFFKLPHSMVIRSITVSSVIGVLTLMLFPLVLRMWIRSICLSENLR